MAGPQVSASPLPVPEAAPAPGGLDLMLRAMSAATPQLDPGVTTAIAQGSQAQGDPTAAVSAAQGVMGYQNAASMVDQLNSYDLSDRVATYNAMPRSIQQQLQAAGFKPPSKGGGGIGGFFSRDILHPLASVITSPLKSQVGKDVLGGLGAGLSFSQHLERMNILAGSPVSPMGIAPPQALASRPQGEAPGQPDLNRWQSVLHPSEWARAWDETSNGQTYILPQVQRAVQKQYGDDTYQLALKLAYGADPTTLVNALPADQQGAMLNRLQTDPKLQQATAALNAGHLSFGHMVMTPNFIIHHPRLGNDMSGLLDAAYDWNMDPTVAAGKAGKALSVMKYFVGDSEAVRDLYYGGAHWKVALRNGVTPMPAAQPANLIDAVRYSGSQNFRTAVQDIASRIRNQGTDASAGLLERYPQLQPVIGHMVQEGMDTPTKVLDFFADGMGGTASIINGKAARIGDLQGGVVPHLRYIGQERLATKLSKAIDFTADGPNTLPVDPEDVIDHPANPPGPIKSIAVGAARWGLGGKTQSLRRLSTLVSQTSTFDPNNPENLGRLRDIALYALPRAQADQVVNAFAATSDLGLKRQIFAGLMENMGHAAGMDEDSALWQHYMSRFTMEGGDNVAAPTRRFAPNGEDTFDTGHTNPTNVAITENQATDEWGIPDFKVFRMNAKKSAMMRATVGATNAGWMDKYMRLWRGMTLARPGFGLRVAGDEAFAFILREGPLAYVKARLASSLAERAAGTSEVSPAVQQARSIYNRMTEDMPQGIRNKIVNPTDLAAAQLGQSARTALKNVDGALSQGKYMAGARKLIQNGVQDTEGGYADHIWASTQPFDTDLAKGRPQPVMLQSGRKLNAEFVRTGKYVQLEKGHDQYLMALHNQLDELAASRWANTSMTHIDAPPEQRIAQVSDHIQANEKFWKRFIRYQGTRDGNLVATGETTRQAAAEDHALAVNQLVDASVKTPAGDHIKAAFGAPGKPFGIGDEMTMTEYLQKYGKSPSVEKLGQIPFKDRPDYAKGPEQVLGFGRVGNFLQNLTDKTFEKIVSPQLNWISRQPIFLHNYTVSREAWARQANIWRQSGMAEDKIEELTHQYAMQRAFKLTVPYIHNPELKSQMSVMTRNLAPFWFAQEQAYKRYARTLAVAPWGVRQAQLINSGLVHSGFIHTDQQTGAEYFVYPLTSIAMDAVTRVLSAFGQSATLPIQAGLIGQVAGLSPSFERMGLPNFGPFVVTPLNGLKSMVPRTTALVNTMVGQQAANQGLLKPLLPGNVVRAMDIFAPDALDGSQAASAQMQAIQALEATGHGIGAPATNNRGTYNGIGVPAGLAGKAGDYFTDAQGKQFVMQGDGTWRDNSAAAMDQYLKRVDKWTRTFMLMRAVFGLSGPSSPQVQFNPNNLHEDLQRYLNTSGMTVSQALSAFVQQHPDASPYTVFQTKSGDGMPAPAVAPAMAWMDSHQSFVSAHRDAASYFIPMPDTTGKFDLAAYQEQMAEGFRIRKDPREFYNDVTYAMSASTYFNALDNKNKMLASAGGSNKTAISQAWTQWSQNYMATNPLFADQLTSSKGPLVRAQIMQDVGAALNDPKLPHTPQTVDIATLYDGWHNWQAMITTGPNSPGLSSTMKSTVDQQFAIWAESFVAQHPDVQPLYEKAIKPNLVPVLDAMANAGGQAA
jgi:hypothetical protein